MTQEDLNKLIDADVYCQQRKEPAEFEIRLFLREVDYHCPLCGYELQYRTQKKHNSEKATTILERYARIKLAPNGEELFGRSWSLKEKR